MSTPQEWFEMRSIRRRQLGVAVWIPLRASQVLSKEGEFGYVGFKEEYFGAGTLAVSEPDRKRAAALGWMGAGIRTDHAPYVDDGVYVQADQFLLDNGSVGLNLVMEERGNSHENPVWHLHPDLVLGLRLLREGDTWLSMEEGYDVVARLARNDNGKPTLLEIRAEHLRDFLCARQMFLYVTSYLCE